MRFRNRLVGLIAVVIALWSDLLPLLFAADEAAALKKFEQALAGAAAVSASQRTVDEKAELHRRWFQFAVPELQSCCEQSFGNGNLTEALQWAARETQLAEICLPTGDAARSAAVLKVAEVRFLADASAKETLTAFDRAADETAAGKIPALRIRALIGRTRVCLVQKQEPLQAIARLLVAADSVRKEDEQSSALAVLTVWNFAWFPSYQEATARLAAGDREGALSLLKQRLTTIRDGLVAGGVQPQTARAGDLLLVRFQLEQLDLEETRQALSRLARECDPETFPVFWRVQWLSLRARLATELSLFAEARALLEQALKLTTQHQLVEQHSVLQISLGHLLLRQGDYDAAEVVLREASDAYEKDPRLQQDPQRSVAMVNLAKTYEARGRFGRADELYRSALEFIGRNSPDDVQTLALCRNNLAACEYLAGSFDAARDEYRKVLETLTATLGKDHQRVAETRTNLAWLELEAGNTELAFELFSQAQQTLRETVGPEHVRTAEVMAYAARAAALTGRRDEAVQWLSESLDLREQHLDRTLRSALSERDQLAVIQELRVHPEAPAWPGVFDTWLELAPELGVPVDRQYQRVLTWKGALDRHHVVGTEAGIVDPALLTRQAEVLASLRALYLTGSSRLSRKELKEQIATLEAEANQLQRDIIRSRSQQAHIDAESATELAPSSESLTPARLGAVLPARTAFLDLVQVRRFASRPKGEEVRSEHSYVGFLIRSETGRNAAPASNESGAVVSRIEFGKVEALDAIARTFFASVSSGGLDFRDSGTQLAEIIRRPLEPLLTDVDVLIVCGDGLFHLLPLGALPDLDQNSKDGLWIDHLAFASAGSAQALESRLRWKPSASKPSALVVGGVDYGDPAGAKTVWNPLPGTLVEARHIADVLTGKLHVTDTRLVTGTEAGKATIAAQLGKVQIAHLATHGFFGGKSGRSTDAFGVFDVTAELDSSLVFAGANRTEGDGPDALLTAAELSPRDLRQLRLLVLSACQTGMGHIRAGQGLAGLLGALSRAGVTSTVCSLWEVNDEATSSLMSGFYEAMIAENSPIGLARALRQSQLRLRRGEVRPADGGSFSHPRFWASFFISGSPAGITTVPRESSR